MSVNVPGGVTGEFRATVREREFECFVLPEYPDRLYCVGPEPQVGDQARLVIFPLEKDEPQFEAVFSIPKRPIEQVAGGGPQTVTVEFGGALGNTYSPSTVTIHVRNTVTWTGSFSVHPLVSDDGLWSTVSGGSTFSFAFNSSGTYNYHCQAHGGAGMVGQVIVAP